MGFPSQWAHSRLTQCPERFLQLFSTVEEAEDEIKRWYTMRWYNGTIAVRPQQLRSAATPHCPVNRGCIRCTRAQFYTSISSFLRVVRRRNSIAELAIH